MESEIGRCSILWPLARVRSDSSSRFSGRRRRKAQRRGLNDTRRCWPTSRRRTLGTWLDWQAQGVRVSRNLYYANDRDLMIEVTHGPYKVDNNIFASDYNFDNVAQGGAYIHNLCCGTCRDSSWLI